MKRCPLVLIEWEDSEQPMSAWARLADYEPAAPMRICSVGWLIQDDPDMKALAPNVGGIDANTAQASGIVRIPARCVVSIQKLKEPKLTSSSPDPCPAPSSHPVRGRTRKRASALPS